MQDRVRSRGDQGNAGTACDEKNLKIEAHIGTPQNKEKHHLDTDAVSPLCAESETVSFFPRRIPQKRQTTAARRK